MFPSNLIRHKDPEIFIGLATPLGTQVEQVCESLTEALQEFGYKLEPIRVIEQLAEFDGFLTSESSFAEVKIKSRMDDGDTFRKLTRRNDALALLSLGAVRRFRKKHRSTNKPLPRQAYLFRSLKRPEEVTAFRRIYGSNFILIGVHSSRQDRVQHLAQRIMESHYSAQKDKFRDKAESLIIRDESDEAKSFGQRLRSAFALADFFIDATDSQRLQSDIQRILQLLFGKPVITPTPDELGMAHAYVAGMRSAELGRQVGAAILDTSANLVAIGTNEVPRAYGGYYTDGDAYDKRDWRLGRDSSDFYKRLSLGELLQTLSRKNMLSKKLKDLSVAKLTEKLAPDLKQTRYMQLIEFVRAVHAEMSALVDAASRGVPVKGCTLYVTTFPCHECARHIVASGIERVVYIEPYAKSLALELHEDAIQLDATTDVNKIAFVPFLGVAPRNHANMFTMSVRKNGDGNLIAWDALNASPRVSGSFWSYLQYESKRPAETAMAGWM